MTTSIADAVAHILALSTGSGNPDRHLLFP